MPAEDFTIVAQWCEPGKGWQRLEATVTCTYEAAGQEQIKTARKMEEQHGDKNMWTVDLYCDGHPEHGSYYQLFHGRVS